MNFKFVKLSGLALTSLSGLASAHCPLCSAAVGAAAVAASYYGFPPALIGVFVGAFGYLTGLWIGKKLKQVIPFQPFLLGVLSFFLTVLPILSLFPEDSVFSVNLFGVSGGYFNRVYVFNEFFLGTVFGLIFSLIGMFVHKKIKERFGRVLFPFQGVVLTVISLGLADLLLYFILR